MSVFAGTYQSVSDIYNQFTLRLDPEGDKTLTGTVTNDTRDYEVALEGQFVPWDNYHNRYLIILYGSVESRDPNKQPPILWLSTAFVGFAEAGSSTEQLTSLTLVQSWASDEPLGHGNSAGSWPKPIGFTRTSDWGLPLPE
jgi:hypothetical protein